MGHPSFSETTWCDHPGIQPQVVQLGGHHVDQVLEGEGGPCAAVVQVEDRLVQACWVTWELPHCIEASQDTELGAIWGGGNRDSQFSFKTLNSLGDWEGYDHTIITHEHFSPCQVADGGESCLGVRQDVPNPRQPKEEVVEGLEGAGVREGHGEGGQHVGCDRVFLLNISAKIFRSPPEGELEREVLSGGWYV